MTRKQKRAKPVLELEVAQQLLERLASPRALSISILLKYEAFDEIIGLKVDPLHYLDEKTFFLDYQATRLLQKSAWLPTSFDKKAVALESFWAAELSCRRTNEFLRAYSSGTASFANPRVERFFRTAQRKVRSMLRGYSPYGFLDNCGFGPGVDLSTTGGFTAAYNKLSSTGTVTRGASIFIDFMAQHSLLSWVGFDWCIKTRSINVERVQGNRVTFVPKDCKTDRTIAVEPRWNAFFQKGMGVWLRKILRSHGVNLDDQSINQHRACYGSIHDTLATIDLQSASDSVSYELIRLLLPAEWVAVLDRLRSPSFLLNGIWHRAEKWSSMGNGYTFELESLVFYALCWSVSGANATVYGDDLVIPRDSALETVELLSTCGFMINRKKSFTAGPFRESCGGDFFLGRFVTPIYWKKALNAEGTLRLVNQVSVLARRVRDDRSRDRRYRRVWRGLVYRLPEKLRQYGPVTVGSCVHAPLEEWGRRAGSGWDGWQVDLWMPVPVKHRYHLYEPALLSQFFQPSSDGYQIRERTVLKKVKGVFFPRGGLIPWEAIDVGHWV